MLRKWVREEVLRVSKFRDCVELEVEAMVGDINLVKLLDGVKGQPPVDRTVVVDVLVKVSESVRRHAKSVAVIDLNRTITSPTGVEISDARIILKS